MTSQERNREALIDHIAEQDRIIRRRNEQIAQQAEKAEMESGRAAEVAERWREAYDDLVSLRRTDQPRPLTADDGMLSRAVLEARKHRGTCDAFHSEVQAIVNAALTEPPSRPEGAEDLETVIGCNAGGWTTGAESVRALADLLASKGVRVTGGQS